MLRLKFVGYFNCQFNSVTTLKMRNFTRFQSTIELEKTMNTDIKEDKIDMSVFLNKVEKRINTSKIIQVEGEKNVMTLSEIEHFFDHHNIFYERTPHNRYFIFDCPHCFVHLSASISPFNCSISCRNCGSNRKFQDIQQPLKYMPKNSRKTNRILNPISYLKMEEDLDVDLDDAVSLRMKRNEIIKTISDMSQLDSDLEEPSTMAHGRDHEREVYELWQDTMSLRELKSANNCAELYRMLNLDLISSGTLSKYNVRGHVDGHERPAFCYPRYRNSRGKDRNCPVGFKLIRLLGQSLDKKVLPQTNDDQDRVFSGIFGWNLVRPSDRQIVLTTNERDALAIHDATRELTVALPLGERLDHQVLPYLEHFDKIYLWFPHYQQHFARDYAAYLNGTRCYVVTNRERPIELARKGRKNTIGAVLSSEKVTKRVRTDHFRTSSEFRSEIRNELFNHRANKEGIAQWKRFAILNNFLYGLRPGELTVLTGSTGCGKTTFMCEYVVDLMTQGIRTLFCSFEMEDVKILKWMIVQFAGPRRVRSLVNFRTFRVCHTSTRPLYRPENHPDVDRWLDRFERIEGGLVTMNTAKFEGRHTHEIAQAIREQIVSAGIQHVVIDNLQFLVGMTTLAGRSDDSFDRFQRQDLFVGLIRKIASETKAHITLVVHPRKEPVNIDLSIQSIAGTGRVTQEADNVLIIQRRRTTLDTFTKFLYIIKNRFGQRKVENDRLEMLFNPKIFSHTIVDVERV